MIDHSMHDILKQGAAKPMSPIIDQRQQALQAFLADLPQLLAELPGQWIAYEGHRLLGTAEHKHELYRQCLQRGLQREAFVVFCIEAQETEMTLGPGVRDE